MRWSIIRLIWLRELRDQLRDRRTILMIAVLPLLIYPLAGVGFLYFASLLAARPTTIGIIGLEELHPWRLYQSPESHGRAASLLLIVPTANAVPLINLAALQLVPSRDYPPLLIEENDRLTVREMYAPSGSFASLRVRSIASSNDDTQGIEALDRSALDAKEVDVLLIAPPGFQRRLAQGQTPRLYVFSREKDDTSRLASVRVTATLARWERDLMAARFLQRGLPADFDDTLNLIQPGSGPGKAEAESVFALLVRIFPFILVMWSLAGALYPAVDICAGEKERGTMETLLISPASREEIVWGKFLTIWVFSTATALLNLVGMVGTVLVASSAAPLIQLQPLALVWAVLLLLPLSAFFSALCLAVGAYARSSKEGQYYLMPLFLLTMPLIILTLAPGVELNPFYSMVPVTGVALLLQRLMLNVSGDGNVWLYFIPVLAPMIIYSWLALRWAITQFQSEEVLFREAERLDLGLWLSRLFRDKEPMPSPGEAWFCFGLIFALRWLSLLLGTSAPLWLRTGVAQLAFVAAPPLLMTLLLTTRPLAGLSLRRPVWLSLPLAALLAVALLPILSELTLLILAQFPGLRSLLELNHPLTRELAAIARGESPLGLQLFVVLGILPAICEELAFRGFILTGLRQSFRPLSAILLSSFLFALYQMNVFQFLPHFLFGIVLAVLVVRTGSIWPAIVFHLVYNSVLIGPALMPGIFSGLETISGWVRLVAALTGLMIALSIFLLLSRLVPEPAT
ncbi:MAG: ABC transporter permease subunit/CPBP intramembrane protease [Gemmataceae bacterium]